MPKLIWDAIGTREYETGTSKGVLFLQKPDGTYDKGVAWSGLTAVKQSPDGAEDTAIYADNIKYLSMQSAENLKGTVEAYTYPDEFAECDGSAEILLASGVYAAQQARKPFGLVYSTIIGNDTLGNDYGEKLHIVYNAKVSPSERSYETVNDSPAAITFSWGFSTTPVSVEGIPALKRPTSYITVDSTKVNLAKFNAIKDLVYGTVALESKMPSLAELLAIVTAPNPVTTTTTTTVPTTTTTSV